MNLNISDFEKFLGTSQDKIPETIKKYISNSDFSFILCDKNEENAIIEDIDKQISSGVFKKVGQHRKNIWDQGWKENLDAFSASQFDLSSIVPRFLKPSQIVRWNRNYIKPNHEKFEFNFHHILRTWLLYEFMLDSETIYEFGSGSSYNLVSFAEEIQADKSYVGLDWVESAVNLTNLIGKKRGINLSGGLFDLCKPDYSIAIGPSDVALTICSLEQIGDQYDNFISFLLKKKPKICIHIEPLSELYEPQNELDYIALKFHNNRNYLSGFLTRIKKLEKEGVIEILKCHRGYFGSLFHETYNQLIWRVI